MSRERGCKSCLGSSQFDEVTSDIRSEQVIPLESRVSSTHAEVRIKSDPTISSEGNHNFLHFSSLVSSSFIEDLECRVVRRVRRGDVKCLAFFLAVCCVLLKSLMVTKNECMCNYLRT